MENDRYATEFLVTSLENPRGELGVHIAGAVKRAQEALGDAA